MGLIQLSLFFELRRHAKLKYVASYKFFYFLSNKCYKQCIWIQK